MLHFESSCFFKSTETLETLRDLSYEELVKTVENIKEEMKYFNQENDIFVKFLEAHEPTLITDMERILQAAHGIQQGQQVVQVQPRTISHVQVQLPNMNDSDSTLRSIPQASEIITTSKGPRVNLTQKTDLVLREIEEIQISYEKFIKKSKKTKSNLRAESEELEIQSKEVIDAFDAFEKIIVIEAVSEITQKIPAEKFVRYMQDWLKNAQILLEKARLHILSFKLQLAKLKTQKIQKEELGESVDVADLEKMEIQKAHMLSEIRQKNANLLELKHMNSKANLLLVNHKKILQKQQERKKEISNILEDTQKKIEILEVDAEVAEHEVEHEKKRMEDLKKIINIYEAPPVMEYIQRKAELNDLKKELKIWRRRQRVQDVGIATYTKMMCQIMSTKKARKSWYGREGRRSTRVSVLLVDECGEEELESGSSDSFLSEYKI